MAPVKAVGQIELVLAMLISTRYVHEKISPLDIGAILLLMASIIIVLLGSCF